MVTHVLQVCSKRVLEELPTSCALSSPSAGPYSSHPCGGQGSGRHGGVVQDAPWKGKRGRDMTVNVGVAGGSWVSSYIE